LARRLWACIGVLRQPMSWTGSPDQHDLPASGAIERYYGRLAVLAAERNNCLPLNLSESASRASGHVTCHQGWSEVHASYERRT
jgi:hypothetical protein